MKDVRSSEVVWVGERRRAWWCVDSREEDDTKPPVGRLLRGCEGWQDRLRCRVRTYRRGGGGGTALSRMDPW